MRVLSLFDGMSCGQIALNKIGIKPSAYYASEIDKYAIQVTRHNYPDTIQLGDIEGWKDWDIDWGNIDLVIGGSPCQGFSMIGEQLAFDDPRSKLLMVYVDILNHIKKHNPEVKFLLENVRMKTKWLDVIDDLLGVERTAINSRILSAQNRPRFYWFSWDMEEIEDSGVWLRDILQPTEEVEEKYYLSEKLVTGFRNKGGVFRDRFKPHDPEKIMKSYCLTARYFKMAVTDPYIKEGPNRYRKLTPLEAERLQTVPDNYTAVPKISNTQRYKMLGNGWTVDVIAHILAGLK